MNKQGIIRSPFFYVGDKYKLMPEIKTFLPKNINTYVEPFVGGGSSFLNVDAERYVLNDIDPYVITLHKALIQYSDKTDVLFEQLFKLIDNYNLSCSYKGKTVSDELKKKFVKTYYAKHNKDAYLKLKTDFNKNKTDMLRFYLLIIYGFNHMIRFNNSGEFNLPVGNVDFNKNVYVALTDYLHFVSNKNICFYNQDYKTFLSELSLKPDDFVFFDPPYLISMSEYNKLWNEEKEIELYSILDSLNARGIRFALTNLVSHKGKTNNILLEWLKKYNAHPINSNYISFNDNTIKADSKEVLITNYE